jgi:hypothetical protein
VDGDWYEWRQEPALSATVLVQVGVAPGGRLVLTGLRIDSEPTAELLRSIPVGRIEAAANAQLTIVDDTIVTMAPSRRRLPSGAPVEDTRGWETTDPDRAVRRPASSPAGTAPPAGAAGGRRGRPDVFYRDVARAYIDLAQTSPRPAAELAEAHDVPVTTAHRWIKESRRRGFLPPGRPGKAG